MNGFTVLTPTALNKNQPSTSGRNSHILSFSLGVLYNAFHLSSSVKFALVVIATAAATAAFVMIILAIVILALGLRLLGLRLGLLARRLRLLALARRL